MWIKARGLFLLALAGSILLAYLPRFSRRAVAAMPEWLFIGALGTALTLFTIANVSTSAHLETRLATIEALTEHHRFNVEGTTNSGNVDQVLIDGRFYSHQPPAMAVLGTAVYVPARWLGVPQINRTLGVAPRLLVFALNVLPAVLAVWLLVRVWTAAGIDVFATRVMASLLVLGSLYGVYSVTLNQHGLAAALLLVGLLAWERAGTAASARLMLASGLAMSLAAVIDHPAALIWALFTAGTCLRPEWRRRLGWWLSPVLVTMLPTALYYRWIGGSWQPFASRIALFSYLDPRWRKDLTGDHRNTLDFALNYGFDLLFSHRGLIYVTPLIIVAIIGTVLVFRKGGDQAWGASLSLLSAMGIFAYFSLYSLNFSGVCLGVRWFTIFTPLLWRYSWPMFESLRGWRWYLVSVLAGPSVVFALIGMLAPWPADDGVMTPVYQWNEAVRRAVSWLS